MDQMVKETEKIQTKLFTLIIVQSWEMPNLAILLEPFSNLENSV